MATIFDKWNSSVDMEGLQKDIAEAEENGGGEYKEVPVGQYEVKVEKMELKASSKGDPMVSIWFKILSGEYKGSYLFMNQVITQGFQIHQMNTFLRAMGTDLEIQFKDYGQYNQVLLDVYEAVDGAMEYLLDYGQNKKGYSTFTIKEVYDVE